MKKYSLYIIILNLIGLLFYFNLSVSKKEDILKNGKLVLLELAPVDPRSLMQGDYMNLRYEISTNLGTDNIPKRGYFVLQLDKNGVARRVRIQKDNKPLHENEYIINYHGTNSWQISIGADSYFFQEGDAHKYEKAIYGGVKLDNKGNSLLVGLYNKERKRIE
ncbi:GDYXXLXY domain-containing protein [Sphingobacterium sp. UT-1RO-CII-1]|uniref:GDYXXLXY domain-containing protein n=1 Tax=Sphingobacterium sp. UT-1RO-CII-1 TaxID=2995225 RepID=UPI00227B2DF5|nr:GDYXXLXY domain-containing protein [Sphingobacterium sp. UT-1RO-CII-1]MCY4781293.1 GDYXXLXY domain-containing protein [Sphingobacterium sp. UT-1RO-CII-1]